MGGLKIQGPLYNHLCLCMGVQHDNKYLMQSCISPVSTFRILRQNRGLDTRKVNSEFEKIALGLGRYDTASDLSGRVFRRYTTSCICLRLFMLNNNLKRNFPGTTILGICFNNLYVYIYFMSFLPVTI